MSRSLKRFQGFEERGCCTPPPPPPKLQTTQEPPSKLQGKASAVAGLGAGHRQQKTWEALRGFGFRVEPQAFGIGATLPGSLVELAPDAAG